MFASIVIRFVLLRSRLIKQLKKMRKIYFLVLAMIIASSQMTAQNKDLKDYEGKYIFLDQSLTAFADITLANDTTLNISATVGSSDLQYVNDDEFSLPQYGGKIHFIRNEKDNTILGFKISIPMAGVEDLEATKEKDSKETAEKETK